MDVSQGRALVRLSLME